MLRGPRRRTPGTPRRAVRPATVRAAAASSRRCQGARKPGHLGWPWIGGEGLAERFQQAGAVVPALHRHEVYGDVTSEVAQTQVTGDRPRGFEIDRQGRLLASLAV